MQLLQEMRRDGLGPTLPRNPTDLTTTMDNRLEIHTPDGEILDEVHPSIEKGVEFNTIGGADTRSTSIRPNIRNRTRQDTDLNDSPPYRNLSVPLSTSAPRLSRNVPEADPLDDGTNPTFTQWRASIRDKFRENADHFATERSRCTHVWLKTTGLARAYLTPRYTSTDSQFKSVDEMLTCLETYFLTGTEKEEARNRFNDMHMQDKSHSQENFPEFKARFLADVIEEGVPKSEWFYALWNKLPARIRL